MTCVPLLVLSCCLSSTAFNFVSTSSSRLTAGLPGLLKASAKQRTQQSLLSCGQNSNNNINEIHCIHSQAKPSLTIILPAFNEEKRIGKTVRDYSSYLIKNCDSLHQGNRKYQEAQQLHQYSKFDILVVDDGSTDRTCAVVQDIAKSFESVENLFISCMSLPRNEGKGAAISKGVEEVQKRQKMLSQPSYGCKQVQGKYQTGPGSVVLVADADGSGDIKSLEEMTRELLRLVSDPPSRTSIPSSRVDQYYLSSPCHIPAMVVGNRGLNGLSLSRSITRWGFRAAVKLVCGDLRVNDTQCGFKLMTIEAGTLLYSNLNLLRWTNDVEILYRAKLLHIPVAEMTVGWQDKEGSKLATSFWEIIQVSALMLFEIIYMRLQYFVGRWTLM